jgi:hypothetical protein
MIAGEQAHGHNDRASENPFGGFGGDEDGA